MMFITVCVISRCKGSMELIDLMKICDVNIFTFINYFISLRHLKYYYTYCKYSQFNLDGLIYSCSNKIKQKTDNS